jgi:periplasmic divalent cation tolerance protein
MATEYCLIQTTFPTRAAAANVARVLVEKQLAACVQLTPVESIYRWQGEILEEGEVRLQMKTMNRLYSAVVDCIQEHHTYEIPEIIQTPISMGSREYLDWMRDQLVLED